MTLQLFQAAFFYCSSLAESSLNGVVLAQSDECEIVEGNYYFPPDTLNRKYFKESNTATNCFWKGNASYYDIKLDGKVNKDGAWYYPNPKEKAKKIQNYVAFYPSVQVKT